MNPEWFFINNFKAIIATYDNNNFFLFTLSFKYLELAINIILDIIIDKLRGFYVL